MKNMSKILPFLWATLLLFSCSNEGNENGAIEDETPRVDYTEWTDQTELFVEFPVLIVGESSRFAAHFTVMNQHQAVTKGDLKISLISAKHSQTVVAKEPSSPGIFTPSLTPTQAGTYQLVFEINTPSYKDKIVLKEIAVYANLEEAKKANPEEAEGGGISFLKEQAWKMEFQTVAAKEESIHETISCSGIWKVATGNAQSVVSPATGRVYFDQNNWTDGSKVRKGDVLFRISGDGLTTKSLQVDYQKALAQYEQAKAEYNRKKELFEARVLPKAEWEIVERNYRLAKTEFETLNASYSGNSKKVIAPMDGFLKMLVASNGQFVNQGDEVVRISSQSSSVIEMLVPASYYSAMANIENVYWFDPSRGQWDNMNQVGGRILSVGKSVSADKPLLSVYVEVNEGVQAPEGSHSEIQIAFGSAQKCVTIPTSCLLEDYGKYSVIVQTSGESFEQRNIQIGRKNGNHVEVTKGLNKGEMVVSKGAYQVKMASMSGQAPAHGHAH